MSTTFNEAQDFLRDELGNDHNSATARHKTKSKRDESSNYDKKYGYFELDNNSLSVAMTEDGGTLYIRLSGHDGRDGVFCTFTSTSHSMEDIVTLLNDELGIALSEK